MEFELMTITHERVQREYPHLRHNQFQVGDVIRAWDHEPTGMWFENGKFQEPRHFVVGRIKELVITDGSGIAYLIEVAHDTVFEEGARTEVLVPMGMAFGDYDGRVEKVHEVE